MEDSAIDLKAKGDEFFDCEDFPSSLKFRQEYLEKVSEPSDVIDAHLAIAKVYSTSPYYINEAIKAYEKAIEVAGENIPKVVEILATLAKMLCKAAKPDAGLSQFENALTLGSTIKDDKSCAYYNALVEFGRVVLLMDTEGAQAKAMKAVLEAEEGTRRVAGEGSQFHALALAALAEAKKTAGDVEGCIEFNEKAVASKALTELEEARVLTHLGSAYSEKDEMVAKALQCYQRAVELRSKHYSNGEKHFSVAEIYMDIAAEYDVMKQPQKAVEALEKSVPYLSLPSEVMDIQWAWLRKAYASSGLSEDEAKDRYRSVKTLRKQSEMSKHRLPAPERNKEKTKESFLPEAPKKKAQSSKTKNNTKSSKNKKKK